LSARTRAALVSTAEAAAMVGRHESLIRRFCRQGRLPALRVGRFWVLEVEDVRRFFATERPVGRPRREGSL
jgi:excisionase family DNA binding protein